MVKVPEKDGRIDLAEKFAGYLWKDGNYVYISFIISLEPGKGNLKKLFDSIMEQGYGIKIPTPFARMENICKKNNFKHIVEEDDKMGSVDVWIKKPISYQKSIT